jgi:hypothetical protein
VHDAAGISRLPLLIEQIQDLRVLLLALHLHKAGGVNSPFMQVLTSGPFLQPWNRSYKHPTPSGIVGLNGRTYQLMPEDVGDVAELYSLLSQHETSAHFLGTALKRFERAYGRPSQEDRIVDFTIAAESCMVTKDDLSYKFRLRGAALLSASSKAGKWRNPKDAYASLGDLYDARSAIVHDGKLLSEVKQFKKKSAVELAKFVEDCEDLARHIIHASFMRLLAKRFALSKENFVKSLDDLILSSLEQSRSTEPSALSVSPTS